MAKKVYAVLSGRKTGLFFSWEDCRSSVIGWPGAKYKGFLTEDEAREWLEQGNNDPVPPDEEKGLEAWVDGSYDAATGRFSYGMVMLSEEGEEYCSQAFSDASLSPMRNVAGEIMGAQAAMQYAMDKGAENLTIYHDYEGIAAWCTGAWKAGKDGTVAYKAFYEEASQKLKIRFVKVTGHSGVKYNEMADRLAKEALGLA